MNSQQPQPQSVPQVALRFSRYECKYLITEAQAETVRRYVQPYVEPDPYAARRPGYRYGISSLYLDGDRFPLMSETLDGVANRFKLRIRAYTDRPEDPVFFEVKCRHDRRILKERARLSRDAMERLFRDGDADVRLAGREMYSFQSFLHKMHRVRARPRILVRYEREAYQGTFDREVRVTFDRALHGLTVDSVGAFFDRTGWCTVEGAKVILELKFNNSHPPWLAETVRLANLDRISYSKYAHSMDRADPRGLSWRLSNSRS